MFHCNCLQDPLHSLHATQHRFQKAHASTNAKAPISQAAGKTSLFHYLLHHPPISAQHCALPTVAWMMITHPALFIVLLHRDHIPCESESDCARSEPSSNAPAVELCNTKKTSTRQTTNYSSR